MHSIVCVFQSTSSHPLSPFLYSAMSARFLVNACQGDFGLSRKSFERVSHSSSSFLPLSIFFLVETKISFLGFTAPGILSSICRGSG